jgi:SAM-dependent methyltransferase
METRVHGQGPHPDPADPAVQRLRRDLTPLLPRALESRELQLYRDALRLRPDADVRASLLDDLSTYHELPRDECLRRCLHWEELSVQEWHARDRSSPEAIADFYRTVTSWSFDLLWYAYLKAEAVQYPVDVVIARDLPPAVAGGRVLDFGSGAGTAAQLFMSLGYRVDLADVSTSLLDFARFRLERRGLTARYHDLNRVALPDAAYDVVLAVDTLVHVPDLAAAAHALHRCLKPGGLLYANFDVRPPSPENAWHLYSDDLPMRRTLQRAGFEREARLDWFMTRWRHVATGGLAHRARGVRDGVLLGSPLRGWARAARRRRRGER